MKKFNIIDVLIVAIIAAGIIGVGTMKIGGNIMQREEDKKSKGRILATMEITEKFEGFSENVIVGDIVMDKIMNKEIGKIVSKEVRPAEKNTYNRETGETFTAVIPEREDVLVTIEIEDGDEVAVGKPLNIATKNFLGYGYVLEIEDIEEGDDKK